MPRVLIALAVLSLWTTACPPPKPPEQCTGEPPPLTGTDAGVDAGQPPTDGGHDGGTDAGAPEPRNLLEVLDQSSRVLWLAAHPDDETSSAAFLARAKEVAGTLYMATLTRGENSDIVWGGLTRGSQIGAARAQLLRESAATLRADGVDIGPYVNGPLSLQQLDSQPADAGHQDWGPTATSGDVIAKWSTDNQKTPQEYVVELLRRFKPDTVVAMDPVCGVSGHDEHLAAGRLLLSAIPLAANPTTYPSAGEPWKVRYAIFNAHIIPPLVCCNYCKCEGNDHKEPIEEVLSVEASALFEVTYLKMSCLVAKNYHDTMVPSDPPVNCDAAEAAGLNAFAKGERLRGLTMYERYRVRRFDWGP